MDKVQQEELINDLWRYGHFWNIDKQDVLNVEEKDLSKLTISDPVVKQAIQSWQEADINYDILYKSQRFTRLAKITSDPHEVAAQWSKITPPFDGELDPATQTLINLPRCGIPDHPPFGMIPAPDYAKQLATAGSGSWPAPGCDPDVPATHKSQHSIIVSIDVSRAPARWKDSEYGIKALKAVVDCYAEMGLMVRYDIEGKVSKPQIKKLFQTLAGSTIGWNEFPPSGTCNATISGRLDTGYVPSDYRLWANLECHETGHGVGLGHTRGHIMNPSIVLVWPLTWKGGPSESSMRRYFGGEPIPPLTVDPVSWEDFFSV